MGFWLKMKEAASLPVSGQTPIATQIDLPPDWNLIGRAGPATPVEIALAPVAGKVEAAFGWDSWLYGRSLSLFQRI
ncbi:MAG TPA: hypothetical protein VJ256_00610 [Dehalococcoidia bacterium]|nr:hypothetical protein [Dehalococcoidia bacterium]HLB29133.1 hypothetical protein [Dehalococcoidia bacterium]